MRRWGRAMLLGAPIWGTWAAGAMGQSSHSELLARAARLSVVETPIEDALRALQRSSGVSLGFSPDLLPDVRVNCSCADSTVAGALTVMLAATGLEFRAGARQVLIGRDGGNAVLVSSSIEGVVVEAGTGRPIPGAEISAQDGSVRALSGDDGRFRLRQVASGTELVVTSLGYEQGAAVVSGEGELRVMLERRPLRLSEIVIAPGRYGVLEASPATLTSTVSREDIEAIPQFGDDVFRTLKRMPGVFADDISTKLHVRGGTDRDLLVRLDGVELHEPYHLKDLDGALGIVDVQSLGGIDLVTGGFPAEYGDKTAGVFDMYTRRPPPQGTRTTLGLSLSSISAISQGSVSSGRGQWLLSLRRGFLEYALAVAGVEDEMEPTYWDVLARVQHTLGDEHLVWVELLYGGDDLRWFDEETSSTVSSSWANGYLWSGWRAEVGDRARLETVLSVGRLGRDRLGDVDNPNGGAFTPLSADVDDEASFDFLGIRQDWQLDLSEALMLKVGFDGRRTVGSYDYTSAATRYDVDGGGGLVLLTDSTRVDLAAAGSEVGSYASLRGRVASAVTWEAGIRHDWHEHTDGSDWAPRLLARFDLSERSSLKASWGRYFQAQGVHELSVQDGQRAFAGSEMAEQVAVGVERSWGAISGRLEAYYRRVSNPHPRFVNVAREVDPVMEVMADRLRLDPTRSRSSGAEFTISKDDTGPLSWSAAYALSRAEDRIDGRWAPRTLDQRHTLNIRGVYRAGESWQLSGAWSYHTGWPFTDQILDVEVAASGGGSQQVEVVRRGFGPLNAGRLPAYHRLDVRITRAFTLTRSRLEVFLDVFNLYDRTNLRGYQWYLRGSNGSYAAFRDSGEEQLPILPTLGLRWVF